MVKLSLVAAVLLVLVPLAGVAEPTTMTDTQNVLPFKAVEKTLDNGLKVIVVPTGFPNLVSIQIPVQTGSRNEVEPGKSGFAHFFEHMMFRGTKAYPAERYQQMLTLAGARSNAYTSDDLTNYYMTFAKEDLEAMLKMEADRFQNLDYSIEDFKTESRAVLGEYNKNSADPSEKLYEVMSDKAYTTHTYKHTTMGFLKDIEDMPNQFEYSKVFFDRWYRPEYTTVIVAGDVTPEEVFPLVEKYWGGWKRGTYKVDIPQEPGPKAPVYTHVAWETKTLPLMFVAFHGPRFSENGKDYVAMDTLVDLWFGPTSDIYKRLVEQEQKVDQFGAYVPASVDPGLVTISARLKNAADAVYVRDQILAEIAKTRTTQVEAKRLEDAKSNGRYGFMRRLDNTEAIASTVARFAHHRRSYDTLNNLFRAYATLTPADVQAVAQKYFTDNRMVVATLAHDGLPETMAKLPSVNALAKASPTASTTELKFLVQKSVLPQLNLKLLFTAGSAHDPKGKEGLAALAASMIAEAGSKEMRIDEISKTLFPIAGAFRAQVDREMTTFTGSVHRDNWKLFVDTVLPQLLDPGFREDDFKRLKESQLNELKTDLRANNEEELGKERLQELIFAGTPYGHTVLGTIAGIEAISLDDVRDFVKKAYMTGNLTVGLAGDVPEELQARLRTDLAKLAGPKLEAPQGITGRKQNRINVDIIQKETRATAISFGHPIDVTRSHPDFVALSVARAWLGEHRSSMSHLYQRIRETRGMNYGDYAYIEAFPRGMYMSAPEANIARRAQIFEVWIRPVMPQNAHMALRIALHELENLIDRGMSKEDFESTRNYLMKNVYVVTATQNQQLGYALDSAWYGIPEYTTYMRGALAKLTLDDVNRVVKKHLSARDIQVVVVTKDAEGLKEKLVTNAFSPIKYEAEKPKALLDEDQVIGAKKLDVKNVTITPVEQVFAK
ncbi:MAG: M16 family metallopeptidase [Thermoanaerobaculia bacterium]